MITFSFIFLACGKPGSKIAYQYAPSSDPNVKACINQCQKMKTQCIKLASPGLENVRNIMEQDYYECQRLKASFAGPTEAAYLCEDPYAAKTANIKRCDVEYMECYARCGGEIRIIKQNVK